MVTEVIMKRNLFERQISQRSKDGYFSATDLASAGVVYRASKGLPVFSLQNWKKSDASKEFIKEMEALYGDVWIPARGRGHHTWVHPFLFIDIALNISPSLKIEVYSWIYDSLLEYRNSSGDSFKKMTGALYLNATNKQAFQENIIKVSRQIKKDCGVSDWNEATMLQLEKRDRMHENISLLCDVLKDNREAVRLGILKTTDK